MNVAESKSSIEKSLSKVTFIGQATGLQCFDANTESLQPTSAISGKHKFFLSLNLTFLFGELVLMSFDIYNGHKKQERGGVKTGQVIQFTVYSLVIVLVSASTMNNYLLRGKTKEIFRNCFRISEILSLLNQSADYASFDREFKITAAKLSLSWIVSNSAFMMFIYFYRTQRNILLSGAVAVYAYCMVIVLASYWTLLIRLIGQNLRFIRECLVHLHKKHRMFTLHPETYNSDLSIRRSHEMYNFIGKLKTIYAIIHDSTSLVNELIGIPICLFMVFVAASNISGGYKVFLAINGDIPFSATTVPLCTIYTSSIILVTLVFSCSSAYSIIDDILCLVHKFEFNKFERDAGLSKIALELACQIVQRPIEFKVGGFFCLSQPLLVTIVTGIFTYVMLLVQFY